MCLCLTNLCNKFLPSFEDSDPELDDTQALVILIVIITVLLLVLCSCWCLLCKYCSSHDKVSDTAKLVTKDAEAGDRGRVNDLYRDLERVPPPVLRMCSAPASVMRPHKVDIGPGTRIITVKQNLNEHKFKESLKQLESITLPNKPKLETEV